MARCAGRPPGRFAASGAALAVIGRGKFRCHAQNVAYTFLYVSPQEDAVKTMSYSESRARYAEVLDSVVDDCEEVVITRAGREPAVIVSLAEYQSLKETDYLLRNPANAKRLMESITSLEAGRGTVHELIELD